MAPTRRVAVVLGAGGSVGHAFHCGVLAAVQEATGFDASRANLLVGTSAGSVVATLLAGGISPADLAAPALDRERSVDGARMLSRLTASDRPAEEASPDLDLLRWLRPAAPKLLARLATRPHRARPGLFAAAALPSGQRSNRHVAGHVPILFGDRWPEQVWVPAVRLDDGERVVFGRPGDPAAGLADAVAASCAVPGYYRPVTIHGDRYLDGGVHSPTNLDVVAGGGFDLVVVSSPMSVGADRRWSADLPTRLACAALLARERRKVERTGSEVVVFQPTADDQRVMGLRHLDPSRRREVTRQAHASAREHLRRTPISAVRSPHE